MATVALNCIDTNEILPGMDNKTKTHGFTLMELMMTVAIVGILAMVGYPSYLSHLVKTRRADAQSILMQDANFMERLFTLTGCYNPGPDSICRNADDAVPLCPPQAGNPMPPTLPFCRSPRLGAALYNIGIDRITATTYSLTATPIAGTPQAKDGMMGIDNTGNASWDQNNDGKYGDNENTWNK